MLSRPPSPPPALDPRALGEERALAVVLAALERFAHALAAAPPAGGRRFAAELRPPVRGLLAQLCAAGATRQEAEARLAALAVGAAPPPLTSEVRAWVAAVIASCDGAHARDLRPPAAHRRRAPRPPTTNER